LKRETPARDFPAGVFMGARLLKEFDPDQSTANGELVEAALHGTIAESQGKRHGRFTVIDGGAS
jgi:hypothetical protein